MSIQLPALQLGDFAPSSGINLPLLQVSGISPFDTVAKQIAGMHTLGAPLPLKQITGMHTLGAPPPVKQITGISRTFVAKQITGSHQAIVTKQITGISSLFLARQITGSITRRADLKITGLSRTFAARQFTGMQTLGAPAAVKQIIGRTIITDPVARQITGRHMLGGARPAVAQITGRLRRLATQAPVRTSIVPVVRRHAS